MLKIVPLPPPCDEEVAWMPVCGVFVVVLRIVCEMGDVENLCPEAAAPLLTYLLLLITLLVVSEGDEPTIGLDAD